MQRGQKFVAKILKQSDNPIFLVGWQNCVRASSQSAARLRIALRPMMTKPITDFRVPTVRRAIRLAHAEQLTVGSVDILPNGTLHIEFRPYEVTPGGEIRAVADEAA